MKKNASVLLTTLLLGAGSLGAVNTVAANCASQYSCYGNTGATLARTATRPPPIPPPNRRMNQQRQQAQLQLRSNTPAAPRANNPVPRAQPAQQRPAQQRPVQAAPQQRRAAVTPQPRPTPPTQNQATVPQAQPAPRAIPQTRRPQPQQTATLPARNVPQARPALRNAPPQQATPRRFPPPPTPDSAACRPVQQNLMQRAERLEKQAILASRNNDRAISVRLFRDAAEARRRAQGLNCR